MESKASSYTGRKFAVVSHVLPPAPSGQSVLLERLLCELETGSCCLIHSGREVSSSGSGCLAGQHHQLRQPLRLPVFRIPLLSAMLLLINACWGIFSRTRQIAKIVRKENCDLLIGCTGDLYDLPAAWLASRLTGRPYIAYIMDDYIYQWTGFSRWIASQLEPRIIKTAKRTFVLNEFVRRNYAERYAVQPVIIHNPVRLPELAQLDEEPSVFAGTGVNIVYTGSIYHAHFDAFQNLVEVLKGFDPAQVRLHIYTAQPRGLLEDQGLICPNVVYHPHICQDEVFKVLRSADILFLPLAFHSPIPEVIQTSAPFKMSEYLAIGRTILVHAPAKSFLSWYFNKFDCGAVVNSNDRTLLAESLRKLLNDTELRQRLAKNARGQAEADFSVDANRALFFKHLNHVAAVAGVDQ